MAFNNPQNRVTLKGFVKSEMKDVTAYSIEFDISVPRKPAQGERQMTDLLSVYANKSSVIDFCKSHLKLNTPVIVKGEIRRFYNGKIHICSDDISIKSK